MVVSPPVLSTTVINEVRRLERVVHDRQHNGVEPASFRDAIFLFVYTGRITSALAEVTNGLA